MPITKHLFLFCTCWADIACMHVATKETAIRYYRQSFQMTPLSRSAMPLAAPAFPAASTARTRSTKTPARKVLPGTALEYTSNSASVRSLKFWKAYRAFSRQEYCWVYCLNARSWAAAKLSFLPHCLQIEALRTTTSRRRRPNRRFLAASGCDTSLGKPWQALASLDKILKL